MKGTRLYVGIGNELRGKIVREVHGSWGTFRHFGYVPTTKKKFVLG